VVPLAKLLAESAAAAVRTQERMNEGSAAEAALYQRIVDRWPPELIDLMSPLAPRHRFATTHEFECAFAIARERTVGVDVGIRILNTSVALVHRERVERHSRIRLTVVQTPHTHRS
jgi:hypothetical protein